MKGLMTRNSALHRPDGHVYCRPCASYHLAEVLDCERQI